MLIFFILAFSIGIGEIVNEYVGREYDCKGNIVLATFTIQFAHDNSPVYVFIEEFPKDKVSVASFTLEGQVIRPTLIESFF
jgi:hypothetical protein